MLSYLRSVYLPVGRWAGITCLVCGLPMRTGGRQIFKETVLANGIKIPLLLELTFYSSPALYCLSAKQSKFN